MPDKFHIKSDQNGIEVQLTGNVTGQEIISINEEVSKYLDCTFQIWNFLDAKTIEISPEDMQHIAIQDRSASQKWEINKIAIVGRQDVLKGLDEMYETFSGMWVGRPNRFISRTFTTIDEAIDWVNSNEK